MDTMFDTIGSAVSSIPDFRKILSYKYSAAKDLISNDTKRSEYYKNYEIDAVDESRSGDRNYYKNMSDSFSNLILSIYGYVDRHCFDKHMSGPIMREKQPEVAFRHDMFVTHEIVDNYDELAL